MTGGALETAIVDHIGRVGPIGFDEYAAHALYTPGLGFYAGGGGAGRSRDFLTSPEVGPLFGVVLARALDAWWDELGRPRPFVVVEAGAGRGTLARSLLAAEPECLGALRLVLVEPAQTQWATHPDGVESRVDLPEPGELGDGPVVVLANELLDNLPFGLVELTDDGWCEVRVAVAGATTSAESDESGEADESGGSGRRLVEHLEPLDATRAQWCARQVTPQVSSRAQLGATDLPLTDSGPPPVGGVRANTPSQVSSRAHLDGGTGLDGGPGTAPGVGARVAVQGEAADWLRRTLDLAGAGRVVVFDYCTTTPQMAARPWTDWLRTYARHGRGGHPLAEPGTCDITVEVAVDQLAVVSPPDSDRSQADFLRAHGIDDLVAAGRAAWHDRPDGQVDLAAIAARSRISEADALTDPEGLGGFRVLEWIG